MLVSGIAAAAPSPDHIAAATRGFVFGYSPVAMARTRALTLCGTGGTNAFLDPPVTANPLFRAVVAPNAETLYSTAYLDLRVPADLPAIHPDRHRVGAATDRAGLSGSGAAGEFDRGRT